VHAATAQPLRTPIPGMPPVVAPEPYADRRRRVSPEVAGLAASMSKSRGGPGLCYRSREPLSEPHHIVPSSDLKTLWITSTDYAAPRKPDADRPKTGKPDAVVADPYNLYFTPDGKSAVAERLKRLDFRDPHTMAMQYRTDAAMASTPISRSRQRIFTCGSAAG
jgi:hypothetical protein